MRLKKPKVFCPVLFFALSLITLTSCSSTVPSAHMHQSGNSRAAAILSAAQVPRPPWELWEPSLLSANDQLSQADDLARRGDLSQAINAYRRVAEHSKDRKLREEAFVRYVGTLLKIGHSQEVLLSLSEHVAHQGKTVQDLSAILSLIAAFAYEHQRDLNQTFAWLAMSYKKAGVQTRVASRALQEANRLAEYLPQDLLESFCLTWNVDSVIGPVLNKERFRRSRGKREKEITQSPDWFSAATYITTQNSSTLNTASPTSAVSSESASIGNPGETQSLVLGVLLPLSGKYASYATRVREGIELAVEEPPYVGKVQLAVRDTQGDSEIAGQEYDQLVQQEKPLFIMGPLLLSSTKAVANKAKTSGVGFLTFTKKQGVPDLGPNIFRLGTTAHDQVVDLVAYATSELHIKTFALLAPEINPERVTIHEGSTSAESSSGVDDLVNAFTQEVSMKELSLIAKVTYDPKNEESVRTAVEALQHQDSEKPFDAIFLPDSLGNVWPVLEQLKNSPLGDKQLIGPASWDDHSLLSGFSRLLDNAIFVSGFYLESSSPEVVSFVQNYRRKFNKDPNLLSAQAYDATKYVLRSIDFSSSTQSEGVGTPQEREHGGISASFTSLTPQSLIKKLSSADIYSGATGTLAVNKAHDIERRMKVLRFHQGQIVEVMSGGTLTGIITPQ